MGRSIRPHVGYSDIASLDSSSLTVGVSDTMSNNPTICVLQQLFLSKGYKYPLPSFIPLSPHTKNWKTLLSFSPNSLNPFQAKLVSFWARVCKRFQVWVIVSFISSWACWHRVSFGFVTLGARLLDGWGCPTSLQSCGRPREVCITRLERGLIVKSSSWSLWLLERELGLKETRSSVDFSTET